MPAWQNLRGCHGVWSWLVNTRQLQNLWLDYCGFLQSITSIYSRAQGLYWRTLGWQQGCRC